jgi:hypothetical protein
MADYNTEQAWDILKQFDGSIPTLPPLEDGSSAADVFNHATYDFGPYSVGPNENDLRITNPWDPSLPENRSGYDAPLDKPPAPQADQSKLVMYLAIAGVAISLLALVRR